MHASAWEKYKRTQGGWREHVDLELQPKWGGKTRPHHNVIYVQFYVSRSMSRYQHDTDRYQ